MSELQLTIISLGLSGTVHTFEKPSQVYLNSQVFGLQGK